MTPVVAHTKGQYSVNCSIKTCANRRI